MWFACFIKMTFVFPLAWLIKMYFFLLIVGKQKHATSHTWSRTDAYRTYSGLCCVNIRIPINYILRNSHHQINRNICIVEYFWVIMYYWVYYQPRKTLCLGTRENWILWITFCTSGYLRNFPQISFWAHTFQTLFQYPHTFKYQVP